MARHILPLIPDHDIYTEAFLGGGAIYFSKEPSKVEVVNDVNGEIVNFYKIITTDFWKLNELIQSTLHSREQYEEAMVIYNHPKLFDPIKLETLANVKGKFLLSNYRSDILKLYIDRHKWHIMYFNKQLSASDTKSKRKVEVLVANYDIKAFLADFESQNCA